MHAIPMSSPVKQKVLAYVWQERQLLVFRQPEHPEAGLQVPAGTVEAGEDLACAVLRELHEETGLTNVEQPVRLHRYRIDMAPFGKQEIHDRHVFAMRHRGLAPVAWRHWERHSSDGLEPIAYDLTWLDLGETLPDLAAGQGRTLQMLLQHIDALESSIDPDLDGGHPQ